MSNLELEFPLTFSMKEDITTFEYPYKEGAMDSNTAQEWAELLKAIAHPTRLQILAELLKGTKCVSDMQDLLPASQANISQHLTVLRNAEIVKFTQSGSLRCYYLSRPGLVSAIFRQLGEGETVACRTKDDIAHEKSIPAACCAG